MWWFEFSLVMVMIILLAILFVGINVIMHPKRYLAPSLSRDYHPNAPYDERYDPTVPFDNKRCKVIFATSVDDPPDTDSNGSGVDIDTKSESRGLISRNPRKQARVYCLCQENGLLLMTVSVISVYMYHPREGTDEICSDCYRMRLVFGVIMPAFFSLVALTYFYHIGLIVPVLRLWRRVTGSQYRKKAEADRLKHKPEALSAIDEKDKLISDEKRQLVVDKTQDMERGDISQLKSEAEAQPSSVSASEKPHSKYHNKGTGYSGLIQGIISGTFSGWQRKEEVRPEYLRRLDDGRCCVCAPGYYWGIASRVWYTCPSFILLTLALDFVYNRARTR